MYVRLYKWNNYYLVVKGISNERDDCGIMAVLEGLVILTLILVGVWVGYAYYDEYSHSDKSKDYADAHDTGSISPISYHHISQAESARIHNTVS